MVTISDVCREAGVSKATVSRVINGKSVVNEVTKNRVLAAIESLGYRPNLLAQSLATNKTNSIGLVIPAFDDAHYSGFLTQASASCLEYGKQLLVTDGQHDQEREREAILTLASRHCDAIIVYSRFMTEEQLNELAELIDIPIVVLNRTLSTSEIPYIGFDQSHAGYVATQHLLELGHRSIACVTGASAPTTENTRFNGYKKAMNDYGLIVQNALVEFGNYHLMGGYQACKNILTRRVSFSAVVAFSDEMAIGVEKALAEEGLLVPEQVSIVSIDNSRMVEFAQTPLTSVNMPIKKMMHSAIEQAIELAEQNGSPTNCRIYCGELIERASVRPYRI